jgi:hypothetical protein
MDDWQFGLGSNAYDFGSSGNNFNTVGYTPSYSGSNDFNVGGSGGSGGAGQTTSSDEDGDGGDGGDGGRGGDGGCGGGGGGGPSVGVWRSGRGSLNEITPTAFTVAAGGRGGTSCGVNGSTGLQSNIYP